MIFIGKIGGESVSCQGLVIYLGDIVVETATCCTLEEGI